MKRIPTSEMTLVPAAELLPHPQNPRSGELSVIVASIQANGFYGAMLVQRSTRLILAGNHRFKAGLSLGMTEFPVFWLDVGDALARRIMLVDNRSNDLAGYDDDRLLDLLAKVSAEPKALSGTGYTDDYLKSLIAKCDTHRPPDETVGTVAQRNVTFNLLEVRFIVEHAAYQSWLEKLRQSAGFSKSEITKEILCRLGLSTGP